jgi:hypothetical protein
VKRESWSRHEESLIHAIDEAPQGTSTSTIRLCPGQTP